MRTRGFRTLRKCLGAPDQVVPLVRAKVARGSQEFRCFRGGGRCLGGDFVNNCLGSAPASPENGLFDSVDIANPKQEFLGWCSAPVLQIAEVGGRDLKALGSVPETLFHDFDTPLSQRLADRNGALGRRAAQSCPPGIGACTHVC